MTSFINNGSMTELGDGAYYYNFTVPSVIGIYLYFTNCNVSDRYYFSLDDFHVYENNYSSIPGAVWNNTDRNLTYYQLVNVTNLTVNINSTDVANNVWAYNGTINNNILSQISNSIWTLFNDTHDFINTIVNGVWTRTPRTLTYYPSLQCKFNSYGYNNVNIPTLNTNCD
jgi:hypothetical protein